MAYHQRNFRSFYYETLGVKGVEEKKSLEILLQEQDIDKERLETFCLKFNVPSLYRGVVWKLVLGVLPAHQGIHHYVTSQQCARYEALKHTLVVIQRTCATFPDIPSVYLQLRLMERGELLMKTPTNGVAICPHNHCVARAVSDMFHDEVDGYVIYMKMTEIQEQVKSMQAMLERDFVHFLRLEDSRLYSHITRIGSTLAILYERWFVRLFADVMPNSSLVRIWDKLVAGSFMILVFLGVALLIVCHQAIMRTRDATRISTLLQSFDAERGETAVNKAIELWTNHGSPMITSGLLSGHPTN